MHSLQKVFQEEYVPYTVVNAADKPRYVKNRLSKKLERFIKLRENLFERVYPIKPQLAQKLIDMGYLHFSKFGKFCPVSVSVARGENAPHSSHFVLVTQWRLLSAGL